MWGQMPGMGQDPSQMQGQGQMPPMGMFGPSGQMQPGMRSQGMPGQMPSLGGPQQAMASPAQNPHGRLFNMLMGGLQGAGGNTKAQQQGYNEFGKAFLNALHKGKNKRSNQGFSLPESQVAGMDMMSPGMSPNANQDYSNGMF